MFPNGKEFADELGGADMDLPSTVAKGGRGWVSRVAVVFGTDHSPCAVDDGVFGVVEAVTSNDLLFAISAHPEDGDASTKHLVGVVSGFFGDTSDGDAFKEDAHIDTALFGLDHGLRDLWAGKEVDVEQDL